MAAAARFTLDLRGLDRLRAAAPQAITRALNRSIDSAKTEMVREIRGDMGLQASAVRALIGVRYARADHPVVQLTASGKRLPLMAFSARASRGAGVTAQLRGGKGRYPHAFVQRMRSGHVGVFQRDGKARLPIHQLHGPSIKRVFNKHVTVGLARGQEQLTKNLQSELRYALRETA